jgi:hypothetical protein
VIDELVGLDGELTPLGMQILRERREQERAEELSKIVPLPPSADEASPTFPIGGAEGGKAP